MPRHATKTSFQPKEKHPTWLGGINNLDALSNKTIQNYCREEARRIIKCPKGLIVHHKDKNVRNNNINNLQIMTQREHITLHNKERVNKIKPNSVLRKNILKVIELKKKGLTYREISKRLNINKRMVKRCVTTFNKSIEGGELNE